MSVVLTHFIYSAVFESFKDYVAVEQLDGDNKYDAGEHGLQVRVLHMSSYVCIYTYTQTHIYYKLTELSLRLSSRKQRRV